MKTRITELFGIQHPVIQGGMHWVGFAEMAAAVSNAGGLGILASAIYKSKDEFADAIDRVQELTDKYTEEIDKMVARKESEVMEV